MTTLYPYNDADIDKVFASHEPIWFEKKTLRLEPGQ